MKTGGDAFKTLGRVSGFLIFAEDASALRGIVGFTSLSGSNGVAGAGVARELRDFLFLLEDGPLSTGAFDPVEISGAGITEESGWSVETSAAQFF